MLVVKLAIWSAAAESPYCSLQEIIRSPVPHYQAEFTTNNFDCLYQLANSATCGCGHGFDNYWLRTSNMAVFFNGCIDTTAVSVRAIRSPISRCKSIRIRLRGNSEWCCLTMSKLKLCRWWI